MKKTIALVALSTISYCTYAQDIKMSFPGSKSEAEKKTTSYSEYMAGMNSLIEFSGAIKIYQKGQLRFNYYNGVESVASQVKISETSRFALASLTKPFTAMMVLKLAEAGKIDLQKSISDYLPYYPRKIGAKIKIIDLLNNRSGLPDYTDRFEEVSVTTLNVQDFIVKFCAEEPRFAPGSKYEYSNSGFYVLGGIIEKITGKSFKEVMESEIIAKAGMINSGVFERKRDYNAKLVDGLENMQKAAPFNPIRGFSAGNMYSTVQDMVKWYQALMSYKLLSKKTVDDLFSGKPLQYYKGWGYQNIEGQLAFAHTGGVTGFSTQMLTIPEKDLFIIILANNTPLPLQKIGVDLALISIGKEVSVPHKRQEVKVPPMILKKYVGTYKHANGNELKIGVENETVFLYLLGSKRALKAETLTKFYMDQFGPTIELSFEGGLTWHQNGNSFKYERLNSDAPTLTNKLSLSETDIKKLVGTYTAKNSVIEISWKSNQLIFKKDAENANNLIQKKEWSFYYDANENGYSFKYPVDFKEVNGIVSLIFDGDIPYVKKDKH